MSRMLCCNWDMTHYLAGRVSKTNIFSLPSFNGDGAGLGLSVDDISQGLTAQINGLIIRGLVDTPDWPTERQHRVLQNYLSTLGVS